MLSYDAPNPTKPFMSHKTETPPTPLFACFLSRERIPATYPHPPFSVTCMKGRGHDASLGDGRRPSVGLVASLCPTDNDLCYIVRTVGTL